MHRPKKEDRTFLYSLHSELGDGEEEDLMIS